jgi:hypothetical protein
MLAPLLYLGAAGVAGGLALVYRLALVVQRWIFTRGSRLVYRYATYPTLVRRTWFSEPVSLGQAVLLTLHWAATLVFNCAGVRDMPGAGDRAGVLSILNLVVLICSSRSTLMARIVGTSLRTFQMIHGSIGFMALVQGLVHTVIVLKRVTLDLNNTTHLWGLVVCASPWALPDIANQS